MGWSILAYILLGVTGLWMRRHRTHGEPRPDWLRPLHFMMGGTMVGLVLLLLGIGIVGTLGEFGSLGQSSHLPAGLAVVALTLLSGWSATQIGTISWARSLHVGTNLVLLFGFIFVTFTGWFVVQKYLPN
jgi:hypothetical protein